MTTRVERWTGLDLREQAPALLVGMGHGGTHWVIGTFYLLLPYIKADLDISYAAAGTLITIFNLAAFGANFGSGWLVDVVGRRVLLMMLSLGVGAAALFLCGWADGFVSLACLLVLIGATNHLWHPPAISLLAQMFPDNKGYALSLHALGASVGDAISPLMVGALLAWFSWQGAAPIAALPVFVVVAILGLGLLRLEREGGAVAKEQTKVASGDYFTGILRILRDRAVVGLSIMASFRIAAQHGLLVFVPMYLAIELGAEPIVVGLGVAAMQAGGVIAGPIAGVWSDRVGRRPIVFAGLGISTVIIFLLTLSGSEPVFIAGIAVLGFVLFAVRPVVHGWMMDIAPPDMRGGAVSVLFGGQYLFSMATPVVGGMIADTWGLPAVFYALAATMLVANVVTFMLPSEKQRTGG